MRAVTPSVTVGPFFAPCLCYERGPTMGGDDPGVEIVLSGKLLDGRGMPVDDGLIEIWQAGSDGCYTGTRGFGRCGTDANGAFAFTTIKPGRVRGPGDARQAPHLCVGIYARGLMERLITRCYFGDEASNAQDPILALVPDERRATLIASPQRDGSRSYVFDIALQGTGETVFFRW
jgi:protocatechuate 3,4-dioxygenase, alpha subunit